MSKDTKATPSLRVEFRTPNGGTICGKDLGDAFLKDYVLDQKGDDQVEIRIEATKSKAGNDFYSWDMSGIELPDGFATLVLINGNQLTQGAIRDSKKGNPMRQDVGEFRIGGITYKVSVLIVRTRRPYWVKIVAHKKPGAGSKQN